MKHISKKKIDECLKPKAWDLGNSTLYKLCEDNFDHSTTAKIVAKTWLIGRSYSVALERVKEKKYSSDNFYTERVAPEFKKSNIDNLINELKLLEVNIENSSKILELHFYLTKLTRNITDMDKRSFASKYLHFHLPKLFFIYDSRAAAALKKIVPILPVDMKKYIKILDFDSAYTDFLFRCLYLQKIIANEHDIILTPRELDNLLLEF